MEAIVRIDEIEKTERLRNEAVKRDFTEQYIFRVLYLIEANGIFRAILTALIAKT